MGADSSPGVAQNPWRRAAAQVLVDDLESPALPPEKAHHLRRVLRLGTDEVICATDGRGRWRLGALGPADGVEWQGPVQATGAPSPPLTVGFAALKGNRNELVVQKLTELGIDRIWLLRTERSVVRWDDSRARRQLDRLGRVASEALAQCRRLWLPTIEVVDLDVAMAGTGDEDRQRRPRPVLADAGGRGLTPSDTVVLVGPEGGWSNAERDGVTGVALGENILRAETAAIVAAATMAQLRVGLQRPGLPSLSP